MKQSIQLSLIGFLTFACALLFVPAGAVAQQSGSNPATLTLQNLKTRLKQNKKYLNQAKKSAKHGDAQGLNTALENYDRGMNGLNTAISHGGIQGTPSQQQDAYDNVERATKNHITVLKRLLANSKIPAQGKAGITKALAASQMGRQTALSHLSQLQTQQQAMGQANRPSFGQAGGMGRSGGMGNMGGGMSPMGGPGMGAGMGHAGGPPAGVGGGHGR